MELTGGLRGDFFDQGRGLERIWGNSAARKSRLPVRLGGSAGVTCDEQENVDSWTAMVQGEE